MLFSKFLALALPLCSRPARAQPNNTVQIEAIIAHFTQSGLVPAIMPSFHPSTTLTAAFHEIGSISPGQPLSREQALYAPQLSVTPANSSMTFKGNYTVLMVDAGPPGADQSHGQRRHWLVNGATISGTNVSMAGATAVTQYVPPNPPIGDGPHRFVALLYAQPADFLAPPDLSRANTGTGIFVLGDYVRSSKLGPLVAGTYFTCQRGPATISVSPTSAVVSETLPGYKGAGKATGVAGQNANSGLGATHNAIALFLAPIMGFLAL